MAGTATALVPGVLTILRVVQRDPASRPAMQDANALINTIHVPGSAAMIAALCGMLLLHRTAAELADPERTPAWLLVAVTLFGTAVQVAPWVLYLYLFRRSRYP